jgi:hypothetical protein
MLDMAAMILSSNIRMKTVSRNAHRRLWYSSTRSSSKCPLVTAVKLRHTSVALLHSKNPRKEAACLVSSTAICGLGSCKTRPPNPQLGCNMVPAVTFVGIMRNVPEPFPGKAETSPNSETYKLLIYGHTHYIISSLTKSMLKTKTSYTSCELHSLSKFCSIITHTFCCSDPPKIRDRVYI